ncbi:MAG: 2-oxoacid:acceptor oxidoreductase subunit alpha [Planctomycetes bacterium]|nr:2-oxoacid:acceptor oxidoreductase subunit alpha [Planctomycetota bacterium]
MSTVTSEGTQTHGESAKPIEAIESAIVRFVGDSGDGMQLAGTQFTTTSAVFGNDIATFPDYPAEIRAPAGTLAGVSGFQINFSSRDIHTPGDKVSALMAMNPAALKANIADLEDGGLLIVNVDEFSVPNLKRAHYESNPLDSDAFDRYRVYKIPITKHTFEAVKETGLSTKDASRCKNFYALGVAFWLYDRPLETTLAWINQKFAKVPAVAQANTLALKAGYHFGETAEIFTVRYRIPRAKLAPGKYRNLTGNQATALGLIAAARLAGKPLFYGSYPITPASDILHELSLHKNFDVRTFQAEDEIAAMCSVIGAAYAGAIAVTGTSGPGMALKQEAIGLAMITEVPCLIINAQRGGPSTGLPTKTEQADLWQAIIGRNGECPVPVLAARSASDCFSAAIEAIRVAVKYMTPVILLSDGFIASGSEPWRIPDAADLEKIEIKHADDAETFQPYERNAAGSRPWAIPGTLGLQHRLGGLEKADVTGDVCYDPDNHQHMIELRARKVQNVANDIGDQEVFGEPSGDLLVASWGGTFGAVWSAVQRAQAEGHKVSHMHLRWLLPMPKNTGAILKRFKKILVCELNMGQLQFVLGGHFAIESEGLHKVQGRPFMIGEIHEKIVQVLGGQTP